VIAALVEEKATQVMPVHGLWRVYFLGFSRNGWTSGALSYAAEIQQAPPAGENWTCAGLRLLDLAEVDHDLAAWSV
jgi:hypothetical protein